MNRTLPRIMAVAIAAIPVAAQADWLAVHWGMQPDAVVAAGSGAIQAVEEDKGKRILDKFRLATSHAEVDGIGYTLDYFFEPSSRQLVLINFSPEKADCDLAIASHTMRFGDGHGQVKVQEVQRGKPPLVMTKFDWKDAATGDHISGSDVAVKEYNIRYCQFLRSH